MAQSSWPSPADDRVVTDVQHELLAARFSDDGVYGDPTDTQVVTAGIGLTVDVRADVHASVRGHGWTSGSTGVTLDIAPNSSGQTRVDRIVLRLDRSDWTVRAVVRQGTPGAGPPSLARTTGDTGMYEVLLAGVTVLSGAGAVTVTRGELYVGARVRPCLSHHKNLHPERGEMAWETDTGRLVLWDGRTWLVVYEDSGTVLIDSQLSAWTNASASVLEKRNGTVHMRLGSFERKSGNLAGSAMSRLPVLIPSAYRHPTRDLHILAYISGASLARVIVYSANTDRPGQVWLENYESVRTGQYVMPMSGVSWVV
ncbi:hypothetical protein JL475_24225 [Streptomyces sp. M2CJ-2]|uniref:hypothetical protein n=1 Tax=Streptomyces sp. M2CJ-2 TaxID=2803948 RepID=UPI0019269AE8|nr:hypothetical protein [Streptomyces sp. M2CJ-2]MBL3669042.1 hypothetical protein [Streptomyces sp. M2CJ-2]